MTDRDPGWRTPILVWGAVAPVLLVVSAVVIRLGDIYSQADPLVPFRGDSLLGGWCRYDCGWYTVIANDGYSYTPGFQSSVAFFPGYPLVMRTVGAITGDVTLAGVLVSVACGLAGITLFWRWAAGRLDRSAALVALLLFALYPYAWYLYGAVYGDALFLVTAIGAFLLAERDHTILAGLLAMAASGTRAVGIAVALGLVLLVLDRRGARDGRHLHLSRLRSADYGVLLGFGGLLAWCGYLWHRFDDPFLFSSVQRYWGQPSSPRTWIKYDFFAQLFRSPDRLYAWGLLLQALLAMAVLLSAWWVAKRFGAAYGLYVAVLVLIPAIGSQDFQGLGRYLVGAFPSFALAGEWLARRPAAQWTVLATSAVGLLLGTALFAHGRYLS